MVNINNKMDNIKALIETFLAVSLPLALETISPVLSFISLILGIVYLVYKIRREIDHRKLIDKTKDNESE
tara:strand:- start:188 stop:397 length:210 start_codon:yes stop_codon:yes gene_type:complete